MSDDKPREFWLWNKNKAITLEESVYRFPNPNKEHIHVIEYSAYDKLKNFCKCGGVILADTEDWPCPMCHDCYVFVTAELEQKLKEMKENCQYMIKMDASARQQIEELEEKLSKAVEALEKIADPRKRDHKEPDAYTTLGCVMHIADEALSKIKGGSE